MYRRISVCLWRRTLSLMHNIFNTLHSISDMNGINFETFEEYLRQLERAQTDEQTYQMHKHLSTLLKSVKNHEVQLKTYFQSFRSIAHNISEILFDPVYETFFCTSIKYFYFIIFSAIWKDSLKPLITLKYALKSPPSHRP